MKIPPGFVWFEQQIAEAKFCGLLREGCADAVTECCRRIDGKPDAVCKDRAKIRAVLVGDFFVKRYNLPGWWNQLRRPWRGGRPERVLLVTETLLAHELMAVPVVAALSEKSASGIRDYLITEIFPAGMCEADKVLPLPGSDDGGWQQLLTGILPVVAQWHNAGVEHGDLNLRNICVTADFSQVCPIDLDGGIIHRRRLPPGAVVRELGRLASAFFLAYQGIPPETLAADICRSYHDLTGLSCDRRQVLKRMNYLLGER